MRIDPIVNKRVTRENSAKLGRWIAIGRRRIIQWLIDESLTEDELIQLAERYSDSSQLLAYIGMHPNIRARGLRALVKIALERDDLGALNTVATSARAPLDVLRKLRHYRSDSVQEHARRNIAARQRERGRLVRRRLSRRRRK